jgi:hypothetical protein
MTDILVREHVTTPIDTVYGKVSQANGMQIVLVNGKHAGYLYDHLPGVFHPLSGFPKEMIEEVTKHCEQVTSSLPAHRAETPEADE